MLNWDCINSDCDLFAAAKNHLSSAISNMMFVVNQYAFDGVALDWERTLPNNTNDSVVNRFISALRSALGPDRQLVVAAFPKGAGRNWEASEPKIDRLLLMDYDMAGANSHFCWFNSSLNNPTEYPAGPNSDNDGFSSDGSVLYYEGWGWPASKLVIGIPFYGYVHSRATTPRRPCGSAIMKNYNQLVWDFGWPFGYTFDTEAHAAWKTIPGGYVDAETAQTIKSKIDYVRSNELGGVMEFELGQDYLQDLSPSHPVLAAIQTEMNGAKARPSGQLVPPTNLHVVIR